MKPSTFLNHPHGAGFTRRRPALAAVVLLGMLAGPAFAGETSFKHEYMMRGQILEIETGNVVVCVGKKDGAEVGQVLDVVRHVPASPHAKNAGPRYRREDVGTVKITSLFDEHYATAEVVKGSPKVNDTVELEQ